MRFEVGQDRVQVHFLAAYADAALGFKRFKEILGYPSPEIIVKVNQERYTSLFSTKSLNDLFLFIENHIIHRPSKFYEKVRKHFNNDHQKTLQVLSKKYDNVWQEIHAALLAIKYISIYLPALRYFEVVATRHLKDSFSKNNVEISNEELFILSSVNSYSTLAVKEKIDLLKIALKYYRLKKHDAYIKDIKKHTGKYSYVELHVSTRDPLTTLDFESRLKELFKKSGEELRSQLQGLKKQNIKIKSDKKRILGKYRFNNFEKNILKILEFISETKVKITDHICLLNFKLINAAKKLSKQWGVQGGPFYLMFPDEIKEYAEKQKLDKKITTLIKERKNAVIWAKGDKLKVLFGKQANEFLKKKITQEKVKADEISGTPIFKGELRGRVKIIKSTKDFSKVKKGDILVSSDTTPDFIPVFNKVSAIITDEGGVICHAAIVAREMKIPCIVGTKIATIVLKDNDMVELDAEKGIIKKIKKI